ncbi:allophanate hydrolase subunit 1 [Clostridiaceae bacterium 68-1-5]|uniref:Allophanate hydrolase subunit 1 n=1 Tax=Suipraeoptans intestinalis TaxID=2606628 RepID=A0A6N7USP6_9FIRM|nr:allophanate hydrolase subunit 1 [Suipraeoptans intestinalis]MSR93704.1 allophanate hydrolase subunit 1 [Suipraeoptans intestinalis]
MEAKFLIVGDCAISVQLGEEISLEVNQKVRQLFLRLTEKPIEGILEMVPTYAGLTIHYNPVQIRFGELKALVGERLSGVENIRTVVQMVKEIPICYDKEFALDLEECAAMEDMTEEEFIQVHSGEEYYCYMLGFAPGHPYMARFGRPFHFKRRESPRVRIPGHSVVAAQNLSNMIPFDQPCGWNVIGATPVALCDYRRKDPFLIHAGDWVKYIPVSRREYEKIKEQDCKGNYRVRTYEKRMV